RRERACVFEAAHQSATVVRVQVVANELRHARATIDVATLHVARAVDVLVVDDRLCDPSLVATARDAVFSLHRTPTVIESLPATRRGGDIDLFPSILPDVGDVEIAGLAVE